VDVPVGTIAVRVLGHVYTCPIFSYYVDNELRSAWMLLHNFGHVVHIDGNNSPLFSIGAGLAESAEAYFPDIAYNTTAS